ncbi:heme-binding domain-containing protein [Mucilaginibacter sp. Bleaf8]|uniref:heme-binding domain-containing protein n=1 Tax=Mucilaginibacter sp. Bleaf8 TaxID=2834430 RepID=UPI001BCFFD67|nr:heme-binding domain-containing protein [Mucilaginibacter sp. Bleaf8]MBS7565374.1 heme-binding domain-containing protein [Mucilaginibacter sp. Bleaf8]
MKKYFLIPALAVTIILICLQFIRPKVDNPPVTGDLQAPEQVKAILVRACYDCHSNQTNLRWYDKIQPVYWQVANHVREGRKGLNFSNWDKLAPADRKGKLWEAINQLEEGAMPIKSYTFVHSNAKVSKQDLAVLKNYLAGMVHDMPNDTSKIHALDKQLQAKAAQERQKLPESPNGITYLPDYKSWQVISTSDRFDNETMRVIYGNEIAVKAVKEHHINPWPNGTILAKSAWDKIEDTNGNVTTGAFKQVEFMIKDNEKYKSTKGWGFARFKTPKLTPYGKDAMFTTECINCHKPMHENDFVFTFPIKN